LRPEEQSVHDDKHEQAHDCQAAPLLCGGAAFAFDAHEGVEQGAGYEETRARGKERRQLFDGDADGEEGRSPEEIDGEERGDDTQAERLCGSECGGIGNH
jgi:hypothetical protein